MTHLAEFQTRNGRHRAECSCAWVTPWLSTRYDAQELHRRHADHERTKGA